MFKVLLADELVGDTETTCVLKHLVHVGWAHELAVRIAVAIFVQVRLLLLSFGVS